MAVPSDTTSRTSSTEHRVYIPDFDKSANHDNVITSKKWC